jgi:mersacidin/lichenicidin family type 2 lantibiotic
MSNLVRAWKDNVYLQSLSAEEQALLPANPAGEIELTEAELEAIFGARDTRPAYDNDKVRSEADQIITFQPIYGGIIITLLSLGSSSQCNNVSSPNSSEATDQD